MYTDEEFNVACYELGHPNVEGWDFFTESHDVKIYRLYNQDSGLYHYKIYGFMRDVAPEICAEVYMDTDYRQQWDSFCKELRRVSTTPSGQEVIYWNIRYPFPMSNRDYVFKREMRVFGEGEDRVWAVLADSTTQHDIPECSGTIRVDDFHQIAALRSDGKNGTQAYMRYYDDPKGMIPTWLINWAARTGVPSFLETMQKACRGYTNYKSKGSPTDHC